MGTNLMDEEATTIMAKSFMPTVKTKKELADLQLKGLKWTVNHAYRGSPFYRKRLEEAGVKPGDIRTLKDLQKTPFYNG